MNPSDCYKTHRYKILAWLAVLALFGIVYTYVLEFEYFSNTFQSDTLIYKSVLAAVILGSIMAWRFAKGVKDIAGKMQVWTSFLVLPILTAPLAGSLANRLLSPYPIEIKQLGFFQEKAFASSAMGFIEGEKTEPEGYFVFVVYNGKLERLKSKIPRFIGLEPGGSVSIPIQKGLFGYEVVRW